MLALIGLARNTASAAPNNTGQLLHRANSAVDDCLPHRDNARHVLNAIHAAQLLSRQAPRMRIGLPDAVQVLQWRNGLLGLVPTNLAMVRREFLKASYATPLVESLRPGEVHSLTAPRSPRTLMVSRHSW